MPSDLKGTRRVRDRAIGTAIMGLSLLLASSGCVALENYSATPPFFADHVLRAGQGAEYSSSIGVLRFEFTGVAAVPAADGKETSVLVVNLRRVDSPSWEKLAYLAAGNLEVVAERYQEPASVAARLFVRHPTPASVTADLPLVGFQFWADPQRSHVLLGGKQFESKWTQFAERGTMPMKVVETLTRRESVVHESWEITFSDDSIFPSSVSSSPWGPLQRTQTFRGHGEVFARPSSLHDPPNPMRERLPWEGKAPPETGQLITFPMKEAIAILSSQNRTAGQFMQRFPDFQVCSGFYQTVQPAVPPRLFQWRLELCTSEQENLHGFVEKQDSPLNGITARADVRPSTTPPLHWTLVAHELVVIDKLVERVFLEKGWQFGDRDVLLTYSVDSWERTKKYFADDQTLYNVPSLKFIPKNQSHWTYSMANGQLLFVDETAK